MNRGRRTESRVLFGYFLHDAKSDKPFSLQRTSRFRKPRISSLKRQLRTNPIKPFAASRLFSPPAAAFFCLPQQFSPLRGTFPAALPPLKLSCLLETWSPCSRPFAILPVSAVSDAQKLATGNFLHVRACFCAAKGGKKPRISHREIRGPSLIKP